MVEIVELGPAAAHVAVWFVGLAIAVIVSQLVRIFASIAYFNPSKWLPVGLIVGLAVGALFSYSMASGMSKVQARDNAVGDIESVYGLKFSDGLDYDEVIPTDEGVLWVPNVVSNDGSVLPTVMVVREGNMLTVHASDAKGVEFVELEPVTSR